MTHEERKTNAMRIFCVLIERLAARTITINDCLSVIEKLQLDFSTRTCENMRNVFRGLLNGEFSKASSREMLARLMNMLSKFEAFNIPPLSNYKDEVAEENLDKFLSQLPKHNETNLVFPANEETFTHVTQNGVQFTGRCDLKGGVSVNTNEGDLCPEDVLEFGAWHAFWIHPTLNGFYGYANMKFNYIK